MQKAEGKSIYAESLKDAVMNGNEKELSESLKGYFNAQENVNGKIKKVPSNAATLLSQSEFNRFYIRGVCLEALDKGYENVEIYRARDSSWARPESEMLIGHNVKAQELLTDLRKNIGKQPNLLPDINSGLSVKVK